jgi:AraC-like DNA-binding protein
MKLEQAFPVRPLREFVRSFQQRRAHIRDAPVVYPIAARPDQFLEFYLQDRYAVRVDCSTRPEMAPRSVVVGPCSRRRAELVLSGEFDVFTIQFRPTGFHRIFRARMDELADQAHDARSIIGPPLAGIEQQLADASGFEERVSHASDFLVQRLSTRASADAVPLAAALLLRERGALRVADAAKAAGLSLRQFERRFSEEVGLPPKLYTRIARFYAALEAKRNAPMRRWTEVAHDLGYFDQMHMVRDFEGFTGESPTTFMRRLPDSWA